MSVAFTVPLRGKAATGIHCLSGACAGPSTLTGITVSTLSVTLLSGLVASFLDTTLFLLFLYVSLFNIHYMHMMQVGKIKFMNPCINDKTDCYYCQAFTKSIGSFL